MKAGTRSSLFAKVRLLRAAMLLALPLTGCGGNETSLPSYRGDPHIRGSVERVERVGAYPAFALRLVVWLAGPPKPIPISNGIELYRVVYWSQSNGKPVLVSGLLSLPKSGAVRGTVLWMHGTASSRADSESNGTFSESIPISSVFAGGQYLFAAPDLVGLGVSKEREAYFCNSSTINVATDFLRAAMRVSSDLGRTWNSNLYLAGFSQGGHSAAVLDREFEARSDLPWHVKAAAGIAGPYNLSTISLPFAMKGKAQGDSTYLSMWVLSYSEFYHHPLADALTPHYAQLIPSLLDG